MAQQTINTGSSGNDDTGDEIRTAWTKANANFDELYGGVAVNTTNVQAAGALMDSEVVNLADVKAFDPTNYAAASHTHTVSAITNFNASVDARISPAAVTAAGALMDSEVVNLADVKAFDPANYATDAQGTLAGTALQPGANVSTLTNDAQYVPSDPTGITGADQITNMVSLTQAEYDAILTPEASTFYVITG